MASSSVSLVDHLHRSPLLDRLLARSSPSMKRSWSHRRDRSGSSMHRKGEKPEHAEPSKELLVLHAAPTQAPSLSLMPVHPLLASCQAQLDTTPRVATPYQWPSRQQALLWAALLVTLTGELPVYMRHQCRHFHRIRMRHQPNGSRLEASQAEPRVSSDHHWRQPGQRTG